MSDATRIRSSCLRAFTLVELMMSVALISLIALLLVSMTNSTSATWRYTTGRIEQFRGADNAFESMTRRLSQATLNTYWDYLDASGNPRNAANPAFVPKQYGRMSELRFVTGNMTVGAKKLVSSGSLRRPTQGVFFQAPLGFVDDTTNFSGLDNLINTWGYYVEFRDDALTRPTFISQTLVPLRYRYRLMELMQPSNSLSIYKYTSQMNYVGKNWFTDALPTSAAAATANAANHVLAENVIALILQPKLSKKDELATGQTLSKDYSYDSTVTVATPEINPKNQLPPIVQVTLVAIDETSANRIANGATPPAIDATLDTLFTDTSQFNADMDSLQKILSGMKPPVSYRVFTTNVSIRGAKWSRK
jgi:uncharacterized protein (TIGR02599 family)